LITSDFRLGKFWMKTSGGEDHLVQTDEKANPRDCNRQNV